MAEAVFMPRLGQSVESCIITEWVRKKGDTVKEGEVLFCYETDKASFEETAKISGILLEIFYNEGDEVPVLSNVAVIGKEGEPVDEFRPASATGSARDTVTGDSESSYHADHKGKEAVPAATATGMPEGKVKISPRARSVASAKGISIEGIPGTGPNGRIIVRDIERLASHPVKPVSPAKTQAESGKDFTVVPLSNIRKLIAKNMHSSLQNSAQLTHHITADARKILELRGIYKSRAEKGEIPNITLNDMVCFATIRALEKMPAINSHFLGDRIMTFSKVHLGVAVDTDRGLMVPAIRNADELNLKALANSIRATAESCRKGNVDPDLLSSENASFTISNLGAYGIEFFTPVINLPQSGILGVNTITYRPADIGNGVMGFIPVIGLSLTYDHRALDGAPASAFLKEVKNQVENFSNSLV